ncbi:MAG: glycine--tRNA ligase, partial [bacterium]
RPETCQPLFTNFRNITTALRMRVPFGIAQIGKAFRNEITTKSFLFRQREFEQMEMEFFCHPKDAPEWYERWRDVRVGWHRSIGLKPSRLRTEPHPADKLAHYAKAALDIEYQFPMGWGEIEGIHNRGDWDLSRHGEFSGKTLEYRDDRTGEKFIPYCVETSAGLDRTFLALLCDAYDEDTAPDEKGNLEKRVVLRFRPRVAPIAVAVFPLSRKPDLQEIARQIAADLRQQHNYRSMYDETGSIGKRYRRQDEIGTPLCITVDFDTLEDKAATIRNRDTMEQVRVPVEALPAAVGDQIREMEQSFSQA